MIGRQKPESGAVLLMVLVALALLAAVAAATARLSASAIASTKAETALLGDEIALRSALALVAARMNGPAPLPQDGTIVRLPLPDRVMEARLYAAAGLVNPNTAPRPLLIALFRSADTPPLQAERLADRIISHRSMAQAAGSKRAFVLPSDMRRLLGDQPGLWPHLRRLTTFLGANVNFDPDTAPARLKAVAPPATLDGFDLYAGAATLESAGFLEIYLRSIEPPRGGAIHVSVKIIPSGYRVVALDWPVPQSSEDRNPVP